MRILFIVEHFPCLSETFVLNQVTGLIDNGHDVVLYDMGKPTLPAEHPLVSRYKLNERTWRGIEIPLPKIQRLFTALRALPQFLRCCGFRGLQVFNPFVYGQSAWSLLGFYSSLSLLSRDKHFDCIHCHFGDKGLRALMWQSLGLLNGPISTVFHAHELAGLSEEEGVRLYGLLFKANALLMPISVRWRDRLIQWGATPERIVVHHMGVDVDRFEYSPMFPKDDGPITVLSVGRLVEQKGFEYAIRAVAALKKQVPRVIKYVIVGAGELETRLKELTVKLGIADSVFFVGAQSQDQVLLRMRTANIFLLPSVTAANGFQEGIPVVLMEAMASGLPVVSTRHSGIPELVEHGVSGLLAEERDVAALVQWMSTLISNESLYMSVCLAARNKVDREFNIRTLNVRLIELFREESRRYHLNDRSGC